MKRILMAIIAVAALASCAGNEPKSIILYYSQTGATEAVVTELQKQIVADVERIDVAEAYDGDYMSTINRVIVERGKGFVPTLNPISSDLSKYDIIYLAYPIWFGTYAPPVQALLQSADLSGKTIVPICTFGSGGLESSSADLLKALPSSTIANGFGIRNARIQYASEELNRFLIENGYKQGQIETLPDYSEQAAPTPEEISIYNEATYGYPYPMGEPVSVGSRAVHDGTDYLFTVKSISPAGVAGEGKVFVSCRNGRNTEFTKAIR